MENPGKQQTAYKERQIGNTVYCVTSVYTGEKDLKTTLEELTLRRAMADRGIKDK